MKKYFLATNDVELTSIRFNKQRIQTGESVQNEGLPLLLELYKKHQVKATFFVTGDIAAQFPAIARMIVDNGHELASHGYSHADNMAFDILPYHAQLEELRKSKQLLEDLSGQEVVSFRAPALRVNRYTPRALLDAGFKIDSSIASQRADMMFSFGALKKLNRLSAPRLPYFCAVNDLAKRGTFPIYEIPVSAFMMPYVGTAMRIIPSVTRFLRAALHWEATFNAKPINFLIHPNEMILDEGIDSIERRSENPFKYLLAEKMRRRLKMKNLGMPALQLFEEQLLYFAAKGYQFSTCREYYESIATKQKG